MQYTLKGDIMKKVRFFNKGIDKRCEYCKHSKIYIAEEEILCKYKGAVNSTDSCRKFKYDILKRQPKKVRQGNNYSFEDFVI